MEFHTRKEWLMLSGMMSFLVYASSTFATSDNASLAQSNQTTTYIGITQIGLPDDTHYVFCYEQDCPHPSVKHIFIAEIVKPKPLVMPLPVPSLPTENVNVSKKTVLNTKKISNVRKVKKPVQKSARDCAIEK